MAINEKTFNQILSLHSKGLGEDASLLGILQLIYGHADHRESVKWIKRFYKESVYKKVLSQACNSLIDRSWPDDEITKTLGIDLATFQNSTQETGES